MFSTSESQIAVSELLPKNNIDASLRGLPVRSAS